MLTRVPYMADCFITSTKSGPFSRQHIWKRNAIKSTEAIKTHALKTSRKHFYRNKHQEQHAFSLAQPNPDDRCHHRYRGLSSHRRQSSQRRKGPQQPGPFVVKPRPFMVKPRPFMVKPRALLELKEAEEMRRSCGLSGLGNRKMKNLCSSQN